MVIKIIMMIGLVGKQIVLLNHLEQMLNCKLDRYFDFGFALLDCEALSKSLIKCSNSERSLLVKLNMDDLLKFMERLRLQFDEIELGIDLETSFGTISRIKRRQIC